MPGKSDGKRLERFIRSRWGRRDGGIQGLAKKAKLDADTMYAWFRGEGEPQLGSLRDLARALGVRRSELVAAIDGEIPPEPQSPAPEWASGLQADLVALRRHCNVDITDADVVEADRLLTQAERAVGRTLARRETGGVKKGRGA